MVNLQLCRWTFHTKKLCNRLYSIEIELFSKRKQKNRFFGLPSGGLSSNVCTPSTCIRSSL